MIKIAVCDDEKEICLKLKEIISTYAETNEFKVKIDIFFNGEELTAKLKNSDRYDLMFLDIEMGKINGIELGGFIREELQDEIAQIVYISSKSSYAMQLFKNRPLDFLIKPISAKAVAKTIDKTLKILNINSKCFEFTSEKNIYKIPYKDIIYFESLNRKVILRTVSAKYEFYAKLLKVMEKVSNGDFLYIHKSYIVNYSYIAVACYDEIIVTTGDKLPISQSNRKAVRESIYKHRKESGKNE